MTLWTIRRLLALGCLLSFALALAAPAKIIHAAPDRPVMAFYYPWW
jgi:hypothetical protein